MAELVKKDIYRQRKYFRESAKLLGLEAFYRAPKPDKTYTTYTEIDTNYQPAIKTHILYESYPQQTTVRMLGWTNEMDTEYPLARVDYDLPGLQKGALFILKGGLDTDGGRIFRVSKLSVDALAPDCVTVQLQPEYRTDGPSNNQTPPPVIGNTYLNIEEEA